MSVVDHSYVADGINRIFTSDWEIFSDSHVRVFEGPIGALIEIPKTRYDIINNAVAYDTPPLAGTPVTVQVASTPDDLLNTLTDVGIVAASIDDVNTVAGSIASVNTNATYIDNINNVNTNIATVNTVAGSITNVNAVGGSIGNVNSVATSIVPNLAEILLADTNASTATAQANIATTQAGIATTKATSATASATSATSSAQSASDSATLATTKANSATASATTATTQAGIATTKASEASTSASNASSSASSSSTSEANALSYKTSAYNYSVNSSNSATDSASSATLAQGYASSASSSASSASTSATNASNSATSASNSATNASNSATTASNTVAPFTAHLSDTNNPHSVTKSQVGLGNVDNTSDVNKPISTATQTALDLKANQSTTYTKTEVDTIINSFEALPDQTGNGGKYLTTDGTDANWAELETDFPMSNDSIPVGTSFTIPSGKQLIVDHLNVAGTLDIQGTLATVTGGSLTQTTMKTQSIENSVSASNPVNFPVSPTINGNALYGNSNVLSLLNASGSAPIYACRAWVNFNGTGTVAIRASGNVSSITDNGVAYHEINFTIPMSDINYAVIASGERYDGMTPMEIGEIETTSYKTINKTRLRGLDYDGSNADGRTISVAIFR